MTVGHVMVKAGTMMVFAVVFVVFAVVTVVAHLIEQVAAFDPFAGRASDEHPEPLTAPIARRLHPVS